MVEVRITKFRALCTCTSTTFGMKWLRWLKDKWRRKGYIRNCKIASHDKAPPIQKLLSLEKRYRKPRNHQKIRQKSHNSQDEVVWGGLKRLQGRAIIKKTRLKYILSLLIVPKRRWTSMFFAYQTSSSIETKKMLYTSPKGTSSP